MTFGQFRSDFAGSWLWLGGLSAALAQLVARGLGGAPGPAPLAVLALFAGFAALFLAARAGGGRPLWLLISGGAIAASAWLALPAAGRSAAFGLHALGLWLGAWALVAMIAAGTLKGLWRLIPPAIFGATLLWAWEAAVAALGINRVILPAPSEIWARILRSPDVLWPDLVQTFFKGALTGYAIGCSAAILFALVIDRSPWLKRGLMPVGNFLAALPIIGTAPIFVMWFGFDWQSKAAVVVAMVFFPMLVNTVEGLNATNAQQRDLMHSWSAGWGASLWKLRLPAAMPFLFNGLKICATLALIGAIVAEFFGSPTHGMGFRISTEVGRLQLDMVWAEIAVAALLGSLFYGFWALLERRVTFWHPSQRGR